MSARPPVDLYCTALSKIERGAAEDFSDVLALLRDGQIELGAEREARAK